MQSFKNFKHCKEVSLKIDWQEIFAVVWQGKKQGFKPIKRLDLMRLTDLMGIEKQKNLLLENTKRFIDGKKSNHALLWGAMGSGKSSLVKAVFNELKDDGLRVIELDSTKLKDLPLIADLIENEPFKFIVFCDDLSFEEGDKNYKGLKRAVEGSFELPPENLKIYATSNRRHLLPEYRSENTQAVVDSSEIHYSDAVNEKLSLSDRFGLNISFYNQGIEHYLDLIKQHFGEDPIIIKEAELFARQKASHTGRTAKQFIASFDKL